MFLPLNISLDNILDLDLPLFWLPGGGHIFYSVGLVSGFGQPYTPSGRLEISGTDIIAEEFNRRVEVPAIAGLRGPGSMARSPPGRTG